MQPINQNDIKYDGNDMAIHPYVECGYSLWINLDFINKVKVNVK